MRAVSGRYTLNPFTGGRRRSSSATSYLQLPNHEPRPNINGAAVVNGAAAVNGYNANNRPSLKTKKSHPLSHRPISQRRSQFSSWKARAVAATIMFIVLLGAGIQFAGGALYNRRSPGPEVIVLRPIPDQEVSDPDPPWLQDPETYPWLKFPMLHGLFNGIKTLVPFNKWDPEPQQSELDDPYKPPRDPIPPITPESVQHPLLYDPYPDYDSKAYLAEYAAVEPCFLDENDTIPAPDIFAFSGVPQQQSIPLFGSHKELGFADEVCFERFGRYGPYGYGYGKRKGGLGIGDHTEHEGSEEVWQQQKRIDYRGVDWGKAQKRCYEKNKHRFNNTEQKQSSTIARLFSGVEKKKVPRTAYVLRTWTGFEYTPHEIMTLRAMINELSLKSGGEYDVHLLLHVRDDSIPIFTDKKLYQEVLEKNIPKEFWGITTLWSVQLMRLYYPGPFEEVFENPSEHDGHGVYRAAHLAMQWFGQQFPEYDYMWNWEMDMRYSGHLYDFHEGVAKWAKKQPRKGLWERNTKFYIPAKHGNYSEFTQMVHNELVESGDVPIWGPLSFPSRENLDRLDEVYPPRAWIDDNFEWGVGEEADLITFNPIFDPAKTNWVFKKDITGYALNLPVPPRRCAIITVARLSRRMLDILHQETYKLRHTAFPEMWPPTAAIHHGLKAVYIPHPVYFDRQWPLDYLDQIFNKPKSYMWSVFGWAEHNFLGSTFYYNSVFSGKVWRRWLGEAEDHEGGGKFEREGSGRMCLRPILHHPIKTENSPEE